MEVLYYPGFQEPVILEEGTYKNYGYKVTCNGNNPCGYVTLPKSHSWNSYNHSIMEKKCNTLHVHGGITFIQKDDGMYTIGWDYAHTPMDYVGLMANPDFTYADYPDAKRWTTKEILNDVFSVIQQLMEV